MKSISKRGDQGCIAVKFVGGVIPGNEAALEKASSQAGNRFQLNLLACLGETPKLALSVTSYRPAVMYPRSRLIIQFPSKRFKLGDYQQSQVLFVNVLILKQLTMATSIFLQLLLWGCRHRGQRRVMLVYNVFSPFSVPTLLAAWVTGSTAVALIADTPHSKYGYKGVKGLFERLDFFQQTRVIRRFSGIISLTKQTLDDFASGRPGLVVEGGVNLRELTESPRQVSGALARELHGVRVCLYAGDLDNLNGISMLLEGFSLIADRSVRLWLLGRGECESAVMNAAKCDPRIAFLGFRANDEVRNLQRVVTVLINPRPSQQEITKYTFPSKLLEYMQSGTPVLTTRLPGIPEEYYQHTFTIEVETVEGLAKSLETVFSTSVSELRAKGESARQFVMKEKSWPSQGRLIVSFLRQLVKDSYASPEE